MIGSLGLSNASKFFSEAVMREMGGDAGNLQFVLPPK